MDNDEIWEQHLKGCDKKKMDYGCLIPMLEQARADERATTISKVKTILGRVEKKIRSEARRCESDIGEGELITVYEIKEEGFNQIISLLSTLQQNDKKV